MKTLAVFILANFTFANFTFAEVLAIMVALVLAVVVMLKLLSSESQTQYSPVDASNETILSSQFHVWRNNKVQGPYAMQDLRGLFKTGQINLATLVQENGADDWVPLSVYEDILTPRMNPVPTSKPAPVMQETKGGFNLTKAGGILLALGCVSSLILGVGLVEALLLAAGIILLVVGLSRN